VTARRAVVWEVFLLLCGGGLGGGLGLGAVLFGMDLSTVWCCEMGLPRFLPICSRTSFPSPWFQTQRLLCSAIATSAILPPPSSHPTLSTCLHPPKHPQTPKPNPRSPPNPRPPASMMQASRSSLMWCTITPLSWMTNTLTPSASGGWGWGGGGGGCGGGGLGWCGWGRLWVQQSWFNAFVLRVVGRTMARR